MPRPDDHKRLTFFFIAAAVIMTLSYIFITKPAMERARQQKTAVAEQQVKIAQEEAQLKTVTDALTGAESRIVIDNPSVLGSLPAKGLRFDDLQLKNYFTTLAKTEQVRLLAPAETKKSYFVEIGLLSGDKALNVPTNDTEWKIVAGEALKPGMPVVQEWDNGQGVVFRRTLTIDERYLITIVQNVTNKSGKEITLYPYALVSQSHHTPVKGEEVSFEDRDAGVQHVGPIAYLNEDLHEENYSDVADDGTIAFNNVSGWLGITTKYWLVTLLPENDQVFDARFAHQKGAVGQDIYQVDMRMKPVTIAADASQDVSMRFFSGAKKLDILEAYEKQLDIKKFDLSIDFGVLYLITKPLYHLLSFLGNYFRDEFHLTVSFGVALLTLTVLIRLLTFPLQNKAYRSMNKMKDLAPKLHAIKEKHKNEKDKMKMQQEVMELYKKERINPASGCLPILIQIPIFFALYKVIYITLDMRHAPFWGWIHDLSAPDPTNLWNLFGFFDFQTPAFMVIGAWPILYGISMYIQQSLNPKPDDKMQQQIFAALPWVFMFIFAKFPAGLVIYYTWSNLLGILQQYSVRKLNPKKAES